jgi:hypothetical protein
MHGDKKGFDDLSRRPICKLTLSYDSAQSPKIIQNNGQDLGTSSTLSKSSSDESAEAPTATQRLSTGHPEIRIAPGEESSCSNLDAGAPLQVARARRPGSRFFVHFGPLQDSKAIAESQKLSRTAINKLREDLSGLEASHGGSSIKTLEVICNLAAVLGFEAQGTNGFRQGIDAKFHLGRLLHMPEQYYQAETLLAAAIVGYKSLQLDHLEISALGSLLDLAIQLNLTGRIEEVRNRMWQLLDKSKGATPVEMHFFTIVRLHLARVYFLEGTIGFVWYLVTDIVTKLELLNDNEHRIDKLEAYLEIGCMC